MRTVIIILIVPLHQVKKSLAILFLYCLSTIINGQAGGKQTFNFLELKLSPVISALQGTNLSTPNDNPIVTSRNPALQDSGMLNRLSMSYNNYLSDINFGNMAYSFKFKERQYTAGVLYVNYGKFSGYDPAGISTGTFTADDYSFFLGTSKKLTSKFTAGANFKFVYSQLYNAYANGFALDGGLHYKDSSGKTSASFVIRNAGIIIKNYTAGIKEKMPLRIELSYAKRLPHTPFRFNVLLHNLQQPNMRYIPRDGTLQNTSLDGTQKNERIGFGDNMMRHVSVGTEIILGKYTHLRLGYNHQMRRELSPSERRGLTGVAWGFGVEMFNIHFNYASSAFFPGINTNQFSAVFNLKSIYTKKKKTSEQEN